ncbi:MAG: sulfatase-like hydrolase/transferase [Candidatus Magasanikbacteria bacterium]
MKRIFQNRIFLQSLFALFGIVYFSLYSSLLNFSFSWLSFFFTLSCIFGFILYFRIAKHIFWIVIGELFLVSFFVFSLVNGAVFEVFGKFLRISLGWFTESNMTPSFFVDFVNMIPWYMYVLVCGIFFVSILLIRSNKKGEEKQDILFCGVPLEKTKTLRMKRIPAITVFVLLQVLSFVFAKNIVLSPKGEWWNSKVYFGDIGYAGHVYAEIYGIFGKDMPQLDTVYAQEEIQESVDATSEVVKYPWYREEETGSFSHIRNVFRELGVMQEKEETLLPGYPTKPHIIFYQLESVPAWVFEQNPTPMPYLKKLIEENYHVEHFIPNGCSTINAEFSTLCSQMSVEGKHVSESADGKDFFCLPHLLQEKYGYSTQYLHASEPDFYSRESLGPKWGFEEMYFSPYFEKKESDGVVLSELIAHMKASSEPVFGQVVGYSSHAPHGDDVLQIMKEKYAKDLPLYTQDIHSGVKAGIELDEYGIQTYFWFCLS